MSTIENGRLSLPEIFKFSKEAVMPILETAKYAKDELHNFSERQLEHEIGAIITKKNFVTCYDFCYYSCKLRRADILTYKKNCSTAPYIWIEVKFTAYQHDNLRLVYRNDFDKLSIPKAGRHRAYWIWLYLFERKNSYFDSPKPRTWLRKMTTQQVLKKLRTIGKSTRLRDHLCDKIKEIVDMEKIQDKNIVFSIMPDLGLIKSKDSAALLIVARCR
jgi:hypothetical protein